MKCGKSGGKTTLPWVFRSVRNYIDKKIKYFLVVVLETSIYLSLSQSIKKTNWQFYNSFLNFRSQCFAEEKQNLLGFYGLFYELDWTLHINKEPVHHEPLTSGVLIGCRYSYVDTRAKEWYCWISVSMRAFF